MWCRVQTCRGPLGERLTRDQWADAVEGELAIHNARHGFTATLDKPDIDRRRQVLFPLYDVRVQTFEAGIVVIGYAVQSENAGEVVREVRQAWYCVPAPR
jgi:hypothetical protein